MTYEDSFSACAMIGKIIADAQPRIAYTPADLAKAKAAFSPAAFGKLAASGVLPEDFETFYVLLSFLENYGIASRVDGDYLSGLFGLGRRLDPDAFAADPYISALLPPGRGFCERKIGNFLLTVAEYRRGEIFQYDMPTFGGRLLLPKLGFFPRRVRFPALYEGNIPWVSACPSELNSMAPDIPPAVGRVLVLGLGIGYYPFMISAKEEVSEIVIVERAPEVITLFCEELLPFFPHRDKITVVCADAFDYLAALPAGRFDFCYADIWEGAVDGAACYQKLLPHAARLSGTRFRYWIEEPIKAYLADSGEEESGEEE